MIKNRLPQFAIAAYAATLVATCAHPQPAHAQDASSGLSADANDPDSSIPLPERERQLITVLREEQKRYRSVRDAPQQADVRMALEVRVADFMDVSQEATDWIGIVRGTHSTPEGDAWVVIEIAPGVTISTWTNRFVDRDDLTLIRNFSPLHRELNELKVDQPVQFSATMIMYDISSDEDMVLRPHIIARFHSVKSVIFVTAPAAADATAAPPAAAPPANP
jgi:hypothetical protein